MPVNWNAKKASQNRKKHRVSFEEAQTVFADPLMRIIPDEGHSEDEERFLAIGRSASGRMLIVVHTERQGAPWIISARKASRGEQRRYRNDE